MIDSRSSRLEMLSCPRASAIMVMTAIWLVYALVDATPISAPALMWTPQWVPRAMALPTVLVTPTQRAPLRKGSGAKFTELDRVRFIQEPVSNAQTHGPRTKHLSWSIMTLKRLTTLRSLRIASDLISGSFSGQKQCVHFLAVNPLDEGMDGSDRDLGSGSYRPIERSLLPKSDKVLHEVQILPFLACSSPSSVSAISHL
jgi:hypothetical protein